MAAAFLAAAGTATAPAEALGPAPTKVALHPLHFPDSFTPRQVVAAAGRLWVLGARAPSALTGCDLWEVTPSTLATRAFALPDCPTDVSAGDGEVYLLVNVVEGDTNTRAYHVEAFDPATGLAQVLAPVVLQNVGSAVAHTDLSFGDGSLWLYGYATGTPEVVRISPVSGAVEGTIVNAPPIGGLYPAVAADAAGAWLGGGPGGTAQLDWVPAGSTTARATSYAGPDGEQCDPLAGGARRPGLGRSGDVHAGRPHHVGDDPLGRAVRRRQRGGALTERAGGPVPGGRHAGWAPLGRPVRPEVRRRGGTARDRPDNRRFTRRGFAGLAAQCL